MRSGVKELSAIVFVLAVSACTPPPAPLPPPPPVVVLPPPPPPVMPLPPGGAAASTVLPAYGTDGVRLTPNRGLSAEEQVWHLRAALNVAALSCQGPVWGEVATNYNKYLTVHKVKLNQITKSIDTTFKKRYPGQNGLRVRDTRMTELYNYFSFPPVRPEFCDASLAKTRELAVLPPAGLQDYSINALAEIDGVFIRFYDSYAQYQRDLADWNMRYGPQSFPQPAPVAVVNAPPIGG